MTSARGPGGAAPALALPLLRRGKVRDVYSIPAQPETHAGDAEPRLAIVATDRISAFDVIMPTPVPGKGRLLTAMSVFWFGFIARLGLCQTHLLSTALADLPAGAVPPGAEAEFEGRVTVARACSVVPIECVVRGYLEGSGWREYQQTGAVCGVALPRGLRQCDKLPEPIFTPATKADTGHDENISFERAAELVGLETMGYLRETSLEIYKAAAAHALARGIIIADTKFEFGLEPGADERRGRVWSPPILIDEALTPDSSRFWPAEAYAPGRPQPSYDKQFLREHLERLVAAGKWDKSPPGPALPHDVVAGTLDRYRSALDRLCR